MKKPSSPAHPSLPISQEEFAEVYRKLTVAGLAATKSRRRTEELVQEVCDRLLTTRKWDPAKGPLFPYALATLKSILLDGYRHDKVEQESTANETFQREDVGYATASAEDQLIEQIDRKHEHERADTELRELEARVAHLPLACRVLQLRTEASESDDPPKAQQIAERLGVDVDQVYRANEALRDHLLAIRKARRQAQQDDDEEDDEKKP